MNINKLLPAAYGLLLFVSAFLLFLVQPMVGKMILPYFGGASSVWNTTMMFFQGLLLLGYLYSHFSIIILGLRKQMILHLVLILIPLIVLPISIPKEFALTAAALDNPSFGLLAILLIMVGLPFFFLSASAPLFQKWFSAASHNNSNDPYFLYAASNAGSIWGLLSYPLIIERVSTVHQQTVFWSIGYRVLIFLAFLCAVLIIRNSPKEKPSQAHNPGSSFSGLIHNVSFRQRARWVVMALIPSSLMLSLTTYITTDIASVPLLWIIPLGMYLMSFILAFSKKGIKTPLWTGRLMAIFSLILITLFVLHYSKNEIILISLHSILFLIIALLLHGRLAQERPQVKYLTEYFLWISVGGFCGGVFNAFFAPLLFSTIIEYPLGIALACAFIPTSKITSTKSFLSFPSVILTILSIFLGSVLLACFFNVSFPPYLTAIAFIIGALLSYSLVNKPYEFSAALLIFVISGSMYYRVIRQPVFLSRNFYGTLTIQDNEEKTIRSLIDGKTIHGRERLNKTPSPPTSYFHANGPIGALFNSYHNTQRASYDTSRIGVIGLGVGTMIAYGRADEHWDLFEINPDIVAVATDPSLFSFLSQSKVASQSIIMGDGRLMIEQKPDDHYDIIFLDAFSSGSIPVHLITLEAIKSYISKLSPRGVVVFNISNRILNLEPILANAASTLGLEGYLVLDVEIPDEDRLEGRTSAWWVMLSPDPVYLKELKQTSLARPLKRYENINLWTDDFSDIITPLRLNSLKWNMNYLTPSSYQ